MSFFICYNKNMQKIVPHLWFDKEAEEAVAFYTSLFIDSKKGSVTHYTEAGKEIHGQDAGTVMTIEFELAGQSFIALNAGPMFKFNPSISFFIRCETEAEVDNLYTKLSEGGGIMMPLASYPFSEKYAWVTDKYGVSWQIFFGDADKQKITPCLMFVGHVMGKAEEAMKLYTSVFPDSKISDINRYEEAEKPNVEGTVKHASFWLASQEFMAMDSNLAHNFTFSEAISLLVNCDTQEELDAYWEKLSAVSESEQCGWLKDKFGVSWQMSPTVMRELTSDKNPEQASLVMTAMLKMKKLDIEKLKQAAAGE